MKYFVIGQTKAGSNTFGKELANEYGVKCILEESIGPGNYINARNVWETDDNFLMKITGLSHKAEEMSKLGKVIWIDRKDKLRLYASMKTFGMLAEYVVPFIHGFKEQYPDEEVWKHFFPQDEWRLLEKYVWLVQIKEWFRKKYFKDICEVRYLEDQPWYDETSMVSYICPLREKSIDIVNKTMLEIEKWLPKL